MGMDWWLGRTPEQMARKAERRAKLDESIARRRAKTAERQERIDAKRAELAAASSAPPPAMDEEQRIRRRLDRIYRIENWFLGIQLGLLLFALLVMVAIGVFVFVLLVV